MRLEDYQRRWAEKPVLRAIYEDFYRRMSSACVPGASLEIGGGIGNLQAGTGQLVRMDIQRFRGIDVTADAHRLPFAAQSFANILLFDVLHHLQCPALFFAEAHRVLRPGGRVILVEPGITPLSGLLYRLGHEETVDLDWRPDADCVPDPRKNPYDSNQAIPTILFKHSPATFQNLVAGFRICEARWESLFAYPLSGGFKRWSLIPSAWVRPLLRVEEKLLPLLGWLMAFRLMAILEKSEP